jgi:hypothetical protein
VLAPDHVGEEHLADGAPSRLRVEHPDPGDHVVGDHDGQVAQRIADLALR